MTKPHVDLVERKALLVTRAELDRARVLLAVREIKGVVAPVSTAEHPLCPVCDMSVDPATAPKSIVGGKTYYFCSASDKATFDGAAQKWINALR